jgi:hypothetical protein
VGERIGPGGLIRVHQIVVIDRAAAEDGQLNRRRAVDVFLQIDHVRHAEPAADIAAAGVVVEGAVGDNDPAPKTLPENGMHQPHQIGRFELVRLSQQRIDRAPHPAQAETMNAPIRDRRGVDFLHT